MKFLYLITFIFLNINSVSADFTPIFYTQFTETQKTNLIESIKQSIKYFFDLFYDILVSIPKFFIDNSFVSITALVFVFISFFALYKRRMFLNKQLLNS